MAQSFSTEVVSNSGPFYPITASPNGMAEGIIPVRHADAAPATVASTSRQPEAPRAQDRGQDLQQRAA